ncbi:hypothetical protein J0S82_010360 [Galemys pyrenaicus]|uniref:Uncharacterized protein n=1 Tax=Galemys pyrenaicus TaxID=202257 RepID=A0A8J5ZSA7_GALPY|nr:hypothetical protein J0S82_010360 [Galemys pyrenaicus]
MASDPPPPSLLLWWPPPGAPRGPLRPGCPGPRRVLPSLCAVPSSVSPLCRPCLQLSLSAPFSTRRTPWRDPQPSLGEPPPVGGRTVRMGLSCQRPAGAEPVGAPCPQALLEEAEGPLGLEARGLRCPRSPLLPGQRRGPSGARWWSGRHLPGCFPFGPPGGPQPGAGSHQVSAPQPRRPGLRSPSRAAGPILARPTRQKVGAGPTAGGADVLDPAPQPATPQALGGQPPGLSRRMGHPPPPGARTSSEGQPAGAQQLGCPGPCDGQAGASSRPPPRLPGLGPVSSPTALVTTELEGHPPPRCPDHPQRCLTTRQVLSPAQETALEPPPPQAGPGQAGSAPSFGAGSGSPLPPPGAPCYPRPSSSTPDLADAPQPAGQGVVSGSGWEGVSRRLRLKETSLDPLASWTSTEHAGRAGQRVVPDRPASSPRVTRPRARCPASWTSCVAPRRALRCARARRVCAARRLAVTCQPRPPPRRPPRLLSPAQGTTRAHASLSPTAIARLPRPHAHRKAAGASSPAAQDPSPPAPPATAGCAASFPLRVQALTLAAILHGSQGDVLG